MSTPVPPDAAATPAVTRPGDAAPAGPGLRAFVLAVVIGLALDAVAIAAAALLAGGPGALGALAGTGLALVVSVPTLLTARFALSQSPATFAAVVMGSWLVKMIVLLVAVMALRSVAGISLPWMGIALLLGGLGAAVTEAIALLRAQGPAGPGSGTVGA